MQVALTVWENRISPLFEATRKLLVVDIHGHRVAHERYQSLDGGSSIDRVILLDELGIDTLVCGGISRFSENLLQALGIRIFAFVAGTVEEVLEDMLAGRLGVWDAKAHKKVSSGRKQRSCKTTMI